MLNAGAGRTDITPPVGIAHAGWGAAVHERAEGVDMPFYCTALYLSDGKREVAVLDIDICFLATDLDQEVRDAITRETGIPGDHVRLSTTHTHAGTQFANEWQEQGTELIEPYLSGLPARAVTAVAEARLEARPARVGSGVGECRINVNRRPATPEGRLFTGRNWDGFVDHEVVVMAVDDLEGNPVATVVNYPCHPTVLGPANRLLSPDYPGHMRRTVEQNVGGLCLFAQGASGNQGPVDTFVGEVEVARRLGKRLGIEAARVRLEIDPVPRRERLLEIVPSGADLGMYEDEPTGEPDATLRVVNEIIELPAKDIPPLEGLRADLEHRLAELRETRRTGDDAAIKAAVSRAKKAGIAHWMARLASEGTVRVGVQGIRVGSVAIIGVPAEPFAEIGVEVKRRSPAEHTLFCGYSNGLTGYVPTAEAFEEGGYETGATPFSADAARGMTEACVRVADRLWKD